jgi:hypothetical protein
LDRHWNLVLANGGAAKLVRFLLGAAPRERNLVRQVLQDDLLRPYIANWEEVAGDMVRRLHQEIDWVPTDQTLQSLLAEVLSYPHVPDHLRMRKLESPTLPMLTFVFRKGGTELRFFSTWTTFGTPHDVTLEETRIESSFPADERTAKAWSEVV